MYPHTYVITVPHFILSVSNSTAYRLHYINSYTQPQLCSMPSYSSAIGYRSVSIYGGSLCWNNSTADWAYKIANNAIPRHSKTRVNRYRCYL